MLNPQPRHHFVKQAKFLPFPNKRRFFTHITKMEIWSVESESRFTPHWLFVFSFTRCLFLLYQHRKERSVSVRSQTDGADLRSVLSESCASHVTDYNPDWRHWWRCCQLWPNTEVWKHLHTVFLFFSFLFIYWNTHFQQEVVKISVTGWSVNASSGHQRASFSLIQ